MKKKKTTAQLLKLLGKHRDRLAKERDALRALVDEFKDVLYVANDGLESLEHGQSFL